MKDGTKLTQIVGHCRFSWFGTSDTGREIQDIADAQNRLWHRERMALRFRLFEGIFLPSVRNQSHRDFSMKILTSDSMPKQYHDRLSKQVKDDPNIEIIVSSETQIGKALRPEVSRSLEDHPTAIHFRLDDDDALFHGYTQRLRDIAENQNFAPGTAISFPRGVAAFLHKGVAKHAEYFKTYNAQGLAFVLGDDYLRNPFQVQHRRTGQRSPSFVDPTVHAFQYTLHGVNNTKGYGKTVHIFDVASPSAKKLIARNPHLEEGEVCSEKVERIVNENFRGTTAAKLRECLQSTMDPKHLADQFGF